MKWYLIYYTDLYSQTSIKRSPSGQKTSVLLGQVTS